jgi:adenylate cyclase
VILGLAIGVVAWLLYLGPAGRAIEQKGLDLLFVLRGQLPAPEDIVIVAVDEPSFAELGIQWPWPRSLHAKLVDRLRDAGARVIAFDIIFAEPSTPEEDAALAHALARAGNVVLGTDLRVIETATISQTLRVGPIPMLERVATGIGVVNLVQDSDKVIRTARLSLGDFATFATVVAQKAGWSDTPASNSFLINYLGPSHAVRTVSYSQALTRGDLPDEAFRGKIVFIGRSSGPAGKPVEDSHFTPYFLRGRRRTQGVEIHANIVDTLLRGRPIRPAGWVLELTWIVGLSLSTSLLIGWLAPWTGFGTTLFLVVAEGSLALVAFSVSQTWFPWVISGSAMGGVYGGTMVFRWRQSELEKGLIRRAFQHYLHPVMVQQVLENPEELRLGGKSVESTVLFSDLEGFTRISEGLSASELVALLNEYFSAMTDVILAHRGMLNRTIGDGILALWGVPVPEPNHALAACKAAVAMQRRLASLNQEWEGNGRTPLRMRIGIQTGEIVVGNIGSLERFDYTAIGDNVNLASRLEGVNKLYGTSIILGEDTARLVRDSLELRELDRIKVVGRLGAVGIYECLGEQGELSEDLPAFLDTFRMGLAAYESRDWAKALAIFQQTLALNPADGASRVYIERCLKFLREPPSYDWDGVYVSESK